MKTPCLAEAIVSNEAKWTINDADAKICQKIMYGNAGTLFLEKKKKKTIEEKTFVRQNWYRTGNMVASQ